MCKAEKERKEKVQAAVEACKQCGCAPYVGNTGVWWKKKQ